MTRDPFAPDALLAALNSEDNHGWREWLAEQWPQLVSTARNADLMRWQAAVTALPAVMPSRVALDDDTLAFGRRDDLDDEQAAALERGLRELHPWRKGPFDFFGTVIDTEWRSDWKWQRLLPHITSLAGRTVLDVGCGSGYHLWRMRGAGAALAVGIEPALLYLAQFAAAKRYAPQEPVHIAPCTLEELPLGGARFDTVFSMGVLYHRRDPQAHLAELKAALHPGGELVLETLVVADGEVLRPPGRYAQMRNVFAIPSPPTLAQWLTDAGYRAVRVVDVTPTRTSEQRSTDWMRFQSLADFLDPQDSARTVEGHPAPLRAILVANKPA